LEGTLPVESEDEVEMLARIIALEHLVKHVLWNLIIQRVDQDGGDDQDALDEARRLKTDVTGTLTQSSFPGVDPSMSDHVVALVHDHAERVLRELIEEMEERLGATS
jgi:hypothetical protein